jgi:[methyl-Co(III) methanol-specific corrinoid protein]:coenzyme M methyltransferase
MNTKQEIVDALNGENKGDSPPAIFTQTGTVEMMNACGCPWPGSIFDGDKLIKLALQPHELYGFATVRIPFDITAEATRLGCELSEGTESSQPAVIGSPYETGEVLDPPDFMSVDEFISGGRVAMHISAAERISKEHPDLFLTSAMVGPMSVASYLTGMENFLMAMFITPESTAKWVEKMLPYQCAYAKALSEASDNVFIITEGSEDTLPPEMFDTFVRPYELELISNVSESFSTVHTCGTTDNVLEDLASLGETVLSVEASRDPQGVFDRVGDKVKLIGGVDPIKGLLQGTPDEIRRSARMFNDIGYPIIAPECGVPPQTSGANLLALSTYRD